MQTMDREYNGHVWCNVITTNIKNCFGLSFKKARFLGHLHCMQDGCKHFVSFTSCDEIFWCGECTHIPIIGQMAMSPLASSFGCKFYHAPPLCVTNYKGLIYYVVHILQSISKATIHFGVHKHLVVDGKCKESVHETRRLIIKEVNRTLDAKISTISLSASKTLLVKTSMIMAMA